MRLKCPVRTPGSRRDSPYCAASGRTKRGRSPYRTADRRVADDYLTTIHQQVLRPVEHRSRRRKTVPSKWDHANWTKIEFRLAAAVDWGSAVSSWRCISEQGRGDRLSPLTWKDLSLGQAQRRWLRCCSLVSGGPRLYKAFPDPISTRSSNREPRTRRGAPGSMTVMHPGGAPGRLISLTHCKLAVRWQIRKTHLFDVILCELSAILVYFATPSPLKSAPGFDS
jgi:hypothetical protein